METPPKIIRGSLVRLHRHQRGLLSGVSSASRVQSWRKCPSPVGAIQVPLSPPHRLLRSIISAQWVRRQHLKIFFPRVPPLVGCSPIVAKYNSMFLEGSLSSSVWRWCELCMMSLVTVPMGGRLRLRQRSSQKDNTNSQPRSRPFVLPSCPKDKLSMFTACSSTCTALGRTSRCHRSSSLLTSQICAAGEIKSLIRRLASYLGIDSPRLRDS